MQQELWLRAKSQVLSSIKPLRALRAASASAAAISHSSSSPPTSSPHSHVRATDNNTQATMSHGSSFPSNSNHAPTYPLPPTPRTPNLGHRSRTFNNAHSQSHYHNRDNGVKAEFKRSSSAEGSSGQPNPAKASRTHQELHKELLLALKKGLGLSSKPELQQVLERRKREQSDKEEEEQTRTPLEEVLLKRQQKQLEKEKQDKEKVREEAQLLEFVRIRQNLRKIHTAFQNKASNS